MAQTRNKMKHLLLSVVCVIALVSCQSADIFMDEGASTAALHSMVSSSQIEQINEKLMSYVKVQTRAGEDMDTLNLSVDTLQALFAPLVEDGAAMCDQFIELSNEGEIEISPEELERLKTLNEPELAQFSYFIHAAAMSLSNEECPMDEDTQEEMNVQYKKEDFVDCLAAAIGWDAVTGAIGVVTSTTQLITAKTAWTVGTALIGRCIGWIGLGIAVYDFGNCLYEKQQTNKR